MKIFVDDIRDVPDKSWILCRTISEATRLMHLYFPEIKEISLDHDISYEVRIDGVYRPFPSAETFAVLAHVIGLNYLVHECMPMVTVHSANPIGAKNIEAILASYAASCDISPMAEAHRKK